MPNLFTSIRSRFHPLWRLRKSASFRKFQAKFDRDVFTRIPGTKAKVAVKLIRDASWIVNSSALEPDITAVFLDIYKEINPKFFWDIGGNIGFYSWLTLSYVPDVKVVIFEADKTNHRLIQKTIAKNKFSNAKVLHVAVSDSVGTVEFLVDAASGATGSINEVNNLSDTSSLHHVYGLNTVTVVDSITLDSLVAQGYQVPELIKIDVEGAEHLVLKGAQELLESAKPIIIMETSQPEVLELLRDMDYDVQSINSENVVCIPKHLHSFISKRKA